MTSGGSSVTTGTGGGGANGKGPGSVGGGDGDGGEGGGGGTNAAAIVIPILLLLIIGAAIGGWYWRKRRMAAGATASGVKRNNIEIPNATEVTGGGGATPSVVYHGELPAGWDSHVDPASGHRYYFNRTTGETTWDTPRGKGDPNVFSSAMTPTSKHAATAL